MCTKKRIFYFDSMAIGPPEFEFSFISYIDFVEECNLFFCRTKEFSRSEFKNKIEMTQICHSK